MKKGYVVSLIIIGILIVLSVLLLMNDLTTRTLSDNLNSQTNSNKTETKTEEPQNEIPNENTQKDAQNPTTNITISNKQNDSTMLNYTYDVKISNVSGAILSIKNGEREYLVFDATGNTQFNLLSNESITLVGLPINSTYTITQDSKVGYKTYANGDEITTTSGTINDESTIVFSNNTIVPEQKVEEVKTAPKTQDEEKANKVKNPVTADKGILAVTISLVALFTLVLLKGLKLDKYGEQ